MSFGDSWIVKTRPFVEGCIIGTNLNGIEKVRVAKFLLDTGGSTSCLDFEVISGLNISFVESVSTIVAGGTVKVPSMRYCGISLVIPVYNREGMYRYEISKKLLFRIGTLNVIAGDILHKMNIHSNYFKESNSVKIIDYEEWPGE